MKPKVYLKKNHVLLTIATGLLIVAVLASVYSWTGSDGDNNSRQAAEVENVGRSSVRSERAPAAAQPVSTRRADRRPPGDRAAVSPPPMADNGRKPLPGETIYTMDSVPDQKCGIYWVQSEDGTLLQLAVCTDHSDDEGRIAAHGDHAQTGGGGQFGEGERSKGAGVADGE